MATALALREDIMKSLTTATGGAANSVDDSISSTDETRALASASAAAIVVSTQELPVVTVGGDTPLSPAETPTSNDVVPVAESPPPTSPVSAEDVDVREREKESAAAPRVAGSEAPVTADVACVGGGSGGEAAAGAAAIDETVLHKWGPCLCEEGEDGKHNTVTVESRMWPGINKPGGVGRITKRCVVVEEKYGEKVPIAFYSVKYLLGGSEKNVRETYISCTQEDGEARKVLPRDIFTVPLEEHTRKQRASPGQVQLQRPKAKRAKGPGETSSKPEPRESLPSLSTTCSSGSMPAPSLADWESSMENTGGASPNAKPRKRSRLDDTGDGNRKRGSSGKQDKSSRDNEETSEPHVTDDAAAAPEQKIVYLTEQVVHKKAACPLQADRMAAFRAALPGVFGSNPDESMAMGTFKSRMNEHVSKLESAQSAFDDDELKKGLSFLEAENKVLVAGNGDIYLI